MKDTKKRRRQQVISLKLTEWADLWGVELNEIQEKGKAHKTQDDESTKETEQG